MRCPGQLYQTPLQHARASADLPRYHFLTEHFPAPRFDNSRVYAIGAFPRTSRSACPFTVVGSVMVTRSIRGRHIRFAATKYGGEKRGRRCFHSAHAFEGPQVPPRGVYRVNFMWLGPPGSIDPHEAGKLRVSRQKYVQRMRLTRCQARHVMPQQSRLWSPFGLTDTGLRLMNCRLYQKRFNDILHQQIRHSFLRQYVGPGSRVCISLTLPAHVSSAAHDKAGHLEAGSDLGNFSHTTLVSLAYLTTLKISRAAAARTSR